MKLSHIPHCFDYGNNIKLCRSARPNQPCWIEWHEGRCKWRTELTDPVWGIKLTYFWQPSEEDINAEDWNILS